MWDKQGSLEGLQDLSIQSKPGLMLGSMAHLDLVPRLRCTAMPCGLLTTASGRQLHHAC